MIVRFSVKHKDFEGESISDPAVLEQYVPITDYKQEGRNETSLRAGSVVEVVEKNESGLFQSTPWFCTA